MSETYLTVQEIATRYRVSKMTVYRLIHSGQVASLKIGSTFRVPLSAWKAYLARVAT